jgi:hypothetical protein
MRQTWMVMIEPMARRGTPSHMYPRGGPSPAAWSAQLITL